ncbi:MAG: bifunctional UDP-N-acetylglucosamine diphosphorylase/glucosamine-1-phosphate N-acetyltransferase GlmU [Frankiaceae bacterium]
MSGHPPGAVVVLAAGEGTRMKSQTPKVLHRIGGRSLLGHVLAAVAPLHPRRTLVVIGHGRETVAASLPPGVDPVVQEEQNGTGHAVRVALEHAGAIAPDEVVVVVPGDAPLLTTATLDELVQRHLHDRAAVTLLSAEFADPTGYGRVFRDPAGAVRAVIEERDADAAVKAVREVAVSVYAFTAGPLSTALARLTTDNAQGEEYLTDVVALLVAEGAVVNAHRTGDATETWGVNDRAQLAAAGRRLNDLILADAMRRGVTVTDPLTTWVDVDVELEPDATLLPGTHLRGHTRVARGAMIGPGSVLTDTIVGAGATVENSTCRGAEIGPAAEVGPYTHLRPGARLLAGAKAGAYVEIKASVLGEGAKVPHLSYVGDATIGKRTNIGAATVFCNYDGERKHPTTVGDDVRIGSDTMLVAPVQIGDGAYTGAGSVITEDVPAGALGLGRGRQRNVEGWVQRKRGKREDDR